MTGQEFAAWAVEHGWTVEAAFPRVVTLRRDGRKSTRAYIRHDDGSWRLQARRGRRFYPGARSDEEEVAY